MRLIEYDISSDDDDRFFGSRPSPSWDTRIIVRAFLKKKIKLRTKRICEFCRIRISRYECDIFSDNIEHICMVDRREYISYLLIRDIKYSCTCYIPYYSDLSDEVKPHTIKEDSRLSRRSHWRGRISIERYPSECCTMPESLYTSCCRIIVYSGSSIDE